MTYRLLAGGYRKTFALLEFDPSTAKLKLVAEPPSPPNPSWIEHAAKGADTGALFTAARPDGLSLFTLSEEPKGGTIASLQLKGDTVEVTSERHTNGGPAHVHPMKDLSGVVASNFMGGTCIFIPLNPDGTLSQDSESPNLEFPFTYKDQEAPNPPRQDTPHPHQVVEGSGGKLYVPDLGSDKIWVIKRKGESALEIEGYYESPPGTGPRHMVLSHDEKHIYLLTEMGHNIQAFRVSDPLPAKPLPGFGQKIVPPSVPHGYDFKMDSAEIVTNPVIPNVLYASNRWEMHINEQNPDKPKVDEPKGDAIAIILLSEDGSKLEEMKWVRTGCDTVRGLQISPDGKYAALGGQQDGGVEIYLISGERGDDWKLAAKDESVKNVTDFVWI